MVMCGRASGTTLSIHLLVYPNLFLPSSVPSRGHLTVNKAEKYLLSECFHTSAEEKQQD